MGDVSLRLPIFLHFWAFSTAATGLMVLAAAFVASQPLFDANGGLLGTIIGIWSHPFSFEQCA
jgi:hypothetical protein